MQYAVAVRGIDEAEHCVGNIGCEGCIVVAIGWEFVFGYHNAIGAIGRCASYG